MTRCGKSIIVLTEEEEEEEAEVAAAAAVAVAVAVAADDDAAEPNAHNATAPQSKNFAQQETGVEF
jgi:hypothetical protein